MKKRMIAIVAAMLLVTMSLSACSGSTKYTMGTAGTSGLYYALGGVVSQEIKADEDLDITVVSTDGSMANIESIAAGDFQLATVQSDVMAYAWEGTNTFEAGAIQEFRVIGGLFAEAIQLVTLDPEITSVDQLRGKSVSVGAPGSGGYFNAVDVLAAAGMTEADIIPQYLSYADSMEALKDGKIDATFVTAGAPQAAVSELATARDVCLVNIDGEIADKLLETCPYYVKYTIPANSYDGQTEEVETVTIKATMVVDKDVSEEDVYKITKSMYESAESMTSSFAKAAEMTLENATTGMATPFHTGAAKYYAEQGITVEAE